MHQIETPSELYTVHPQRITSLLGAFYSHAQTIISSPFQITNYTQSDIEKKWTINLLFESGETHELEIPYQDLQDEVSLAESRHIQRNFTESMGVDVPTYKDGYSRAATHFFRTHQIQESDLLGSWFSSRSRLVVSKGMISVTKGFSKIESIFRRIFQPKLMAEWEEQNRETIDAYVSFLKREIGGEKLGQIQKLYHFDFAEMRENGLPLEPKHIYFCNIGMNNIEMDDVKSLGNRISQFFDTNNDSEKLLPILKGENYPFTWREARKILEMVGKDGTVGDLRNALESPFPFETLTEKTFGKLVSLLETPAKDWEAIYTGRKFQKPIIGAYNEEITDRKTFRPWVDQQELLQVFQEMKNPFPEQEVEPKKLDHYFYEVLSKIVVKKHLMRSLSEDEWRVGALIPSPYKNDRGETIYYRVDQGVDSGHGKMWYVFRPACEDDDRSLPVIRVPRDTTPDDYAMRGGPTISRDLAEHAGSLYSSTTLQEDKAFFREFTLPVWMGYLAVAKKSLDQVSEEGPFDSLISHLNHVHRAIIEEISGQILLGTLAQNEGEKILRGLKKLLTKAETPGLMQLSAIKDYVAATLFTVPHEKDDLHRLTELAQGRAPRPFASVGNSLGGFDAQNDLLRHTFGENRIPITRLDLYTHSTLKIDQKDDDLFTDFILTHKDLLLNLDVHLSFQHVTELDDIVSLVTDGTFLGRGLQLAAKQTEEELPADVSLRVFIIIPFSESEEIQEKDVHFRRIEHLEKGKDFILLGQFSSIREYDNYARSYQFQGRRLESWRTMGIQLNLSGKSDTIWRISRFFSELRHPIPKKNTNDKLVVSYNPEGKQQHTFVLVHLTPELDKIFYRPVEVNLAV